MLYAFVLFGAAYAALIVIAYFLALACEQFGIASWLLFPIVFTLPYGLWGMMSFQMLDGAEIGRNVLVIDHHMTAAGWTSLAINTAEQFAIAIAAALVLFAGAKRLNH